MGTRTYSRRGKDGNRYLTPLGRQQSPAAQQGFVLNPPRGAEGPKLSPEQLAGLAEGRPLISDFATNAKAAFTPQYDPNSEGNPPPNRTPEGMRQAWNGTSAAQLAQALPMEGAQLPWQNVMKLPTGEELVGEAQTAYNKRKTKGLALGELAAPLARVLAAGGVQYPPSAGGLRLSIYPQATDVQFRGTSSLTKPMVKAVSKVVDDMDKAHPQVDARTKAEVAAIMDTIGGIALTRAHSYELMATTKGATTPKGQVLDRYNKQAMAQARRLAAEINTKMGYATAVDGKGMLKDKSSPGYKAYHELMSEQSKSHYKRSVFKGQQLAGRLEGLNNN
jgi:hypothetical protein